MLENFIMQVRCPKGVSDEHKAFVSPAAQASAAACVSKIHMCYNKIMYLPPMYLTNRVLVP